MSSEPTEPSFYGEAQRVLQDHFDCRPLADALGATIVKPTVNDEQRSFIESRDFFYLSTVGADGWPTVSYKGGPVGVVHVEDERTLVFPSYDGNGMFLSMGNIEAERKIGLLFIDLVTPNRLRVQASASVSTDDPALARFPGAQLLVRARVEHVFPNCARYVHRHERVDQSPYVPDTDGSQPLPSWKKIDLIQPVLPPSDRGRAAKEGGIIDGQEYVRRLIDGSS